MLNTKVFILTLHEQFNCSVLDLLNTSSFMAAVLKVNYTEGNEQIEISVDQRFTSR